MSLTGVAGTPLTAQAWLRVTPCPPHPEEGQPSTLFRSELHSWDTLPSLNTCVSKQGRNPHRYPCSAPEPFLPQHTKTSLTKPVLPFCKMLPASVKS